MNWRREALLHWKTERGFLYAVGNPLPKDMAFVQAQIYRLNKEIEDEDRRKEIHRAE